MTLENHVIRMYTLSPHRFFQIKNDPDEFETDFNNKFGKIAGAKVTLNRHDPPKFAPDEPIKFNLSVVPDGSDMTELYENSFRVGKEILEFITGKTKDPFLLSASRVFFD
jgi:hypothetical protein